MSIIYQKEFIALRAIFKSKRNQVHKIHLSPYTYPQNICPTCGTRTASLRITLFFQTSTRRFITYGPNPFCVFCYAHLTMLRINSGFFCLILPAAIVSIRISAVLHRILIFSFPRMVWFSNPMETSNRLFTLSTAVLWLYSVFHL